MPTKLTLKKLRSIDRKLPALCVDCGLHPPAHDWGICAECDEKAAREVAEASPEDRERWANMAG